jgi:flagellar M-ring protein FliF
MAFLQNLMRQFTSLFRSMTPSQQAILVVVPLMVLGGFGWLLMQQGGHSEVALSWGKVFSSEELMGVEQALIQDGLTDFRREGQRILVPAAEVDRYNAALLTFDVMPSDLGSQMLKSYESLGPFSTEKERQERREAMLLQEVRRVIQAVPEVADARVAIANSGRRSWNTKSKVTANVTIRTHGGQELTPKLVRSIRSAVGSMVPDLQPNDVTVFDVMNGVSHTGGSADDPLAGELVGHIDQFERKYKGQILDALSYIPDVGVTVNVDVENLKSSVVRNQIVDPKKSAPVFSQETSIKDTQQQQPAKGEPGAGANRPASLASSPGIDRNRSFNDSSTQALNGLSFEVTEKELIAAMPKAVQVNVSVPREYYRSVASQRTTAGETDANLTDPAKIEQAVLTTIKASVKALIPADSPETAVIVNSVDRVVVPAPVLTVPITDQLWKLSREWGGAVGLSLFALYALMMFRRSMPAIPAEPPAEEFSPEKLRAATGQVTEAAVVREATKRDSIQDLVRDNPAATAAIISKWLQAAQ